MPIGEPGGPDSEIFYDFGSEFKFHENSKFANKKCHLNCNCGRYLEIGNSVFMTYVKTKKGFEELKNKNIDFGGGFERILAIMNNETVNITILTHWAILSAPHIGGSSRIKSRLNLITANSRK